MKSLILASTSTIYGGTYLGYLLHELEEHFKNVDEILFIPYARPVGISHDKYTQLAGEAFSNIKKSVKGIHQFNNAHKAIEQAKGIFVGGGNTFVLVNELYKNKLMKTLKIAILQGTPYLGTSAGSNICGLTIGTTNDMPIVKPPHFKTLGIVPFNINPHYIDADSNSKHMGETRATRIKEFHYFNSQPVVGLREGSWLKVSKNGIIIDGKYNVVIFEKNKSVYELNPLNSIRFN